MERAILFDLDGTLVDSAPDLAAALNTTLRRLGRPSVPEETVRRWVGNGAKVLVGRALCRSERIDSELDATLWQEALTLFMASYEACLCERSRLYDGVASTLARLQKGGAVMAVVTNKPQRFVAPLLEHLKIADRFSLLLGGDALPVKKPDPEPLLYACRRLGVSKDRAVMVGDSRNDILAARAAGIFSVAVTWGYNYGESIETYGPDRIVSRFEQIAEIAL